MPSTESPARIVAKLLQNKGAAKAPTPAQDWSVYVGREPPLPLKCITVYDTTGVMEDKTQLGTHSGHPGIQIRVRAPDYADAYTKSSALALVIDAVSRDSVTIGQKVFVVSSVLRLQDPMRIGVEEGTQCELFTFNGHVTILS